MKQLLRYLVNIILFVVLWCLMFLPVMKYSIDMGATSAAAIGGIVAIIISYRLVTRINKSNLWASLFDDEEIVEKQVKGPYYDPDFDMSLDKKTITKSESTPSKKVNSISELSDNLTKLGELKEKGLLTEEEFNEQKKKLLKQ